MNRREFVARSAAAGAAAVPGRRLRARAATAAPWYAAMRRCGQLNFNERDPLTLDVAAWAEYWASLRVNALLVNGGGIMAFYPTDVPYHHRSAFLGTRDLFGEMAAAARAGHPGGGAHGLQLLLGGGAAGAPGVVRARPRRRATPAQRIHLALQDLHVLAVFHRADAGHLPRDRQALCGRRVLRSEERRVGKECT